MSDTEIQPVNPPNENVIEMCGKVVEPQNSPNKNTFHIVGETVETIKLSNKNKADMSEKSADVNEIKSPSVNIVDMSEKTCEVGPINLLNEYIVEIAERSVEQVNPPNNSIDMHERALGVETINTPNKNITEISKKVQVEQIDPSNKHIPIPERSYEVENIDMPIKEIEPMVSTVLESGLSTIENRILSNKVNNIPEENIPMEISETEPASILTENDIIMDENDEIDNYCSNQVKHLSITNELLFEEKALIELSRHSWGTKKQHYLNGCVWSPDGTCVLTAVNGDGMHVVEMPSDLYNIDKVSYNRPVDILQPAVHIKEGGTVYDYCWYPFMDSTKPESCCWIATRQHEPIQMWDAFNGSLRCSYRGYDTVDEVEAAISVCFSSDGTEVIGGYKKSLKIFKTDTPGRDFTNIQLKSSASCLAVHNLKPNLIAIGSWNCAVNIHDVRSPDLQIIDKLLEHTGGVTCIKFTPNAECLLTGARKDSKLLCWDLRKTANPVLCVKRTVQTNQKIYFDTSPCGRWLGSGDTNGIIHVWDLVRASIDNKLCELQFPLHNDCCNGVSFHPFRPIFASSSGQYHFNSNDINLRKNKENSLIFWWHGRSATETDSIPE